VRLDHFLNGSQGLLILESEKERFVALQCVPNESAVSDRGYKDVG